MAQDRYVAKADERIYGTWTNEKNFPPKWVIKADGTYEQYNPITSTVHFKSGKYDIWKNWTDSDGNVWYDIACTDISGAHPGFMFQAVWKINESGEVAEVLRRHVIRFDQSYFITTIDPKDPDYQVYRRSADGNE
jgi:hypothetical protein